MLCSNVDVNDDVDDDLKQREFDIRRSCFDSPPKVGGVPSQRGRWYDYWQENTPSASLRYARPPILRGQSLKESLYRTHVKATNLSRTKHIR